MGSADSLKRGEGGEGTHVDGNDEREVMVYRRAERRLGKRLRRLPVV